MNIMIIAAAMLLLGPAAGSSSSDVIDKDTVKRTLKFGDASADHKLIVDNVNGSISVTGYDGSEIELVAYRKVKAESNSRLEEAKAEVTLDIKEESDRVLVYVDAPWRKQDGSVNYRGWEYYGYEVEYDFELKVPRKLRVLLKTVNDGDIDVEHITGNFEVRNVNGDVRMKDIAGSGAAVTINGDVNMTFSKNPTAECEFKTINGTVEVEFPEPVSASLRLKTMNGDVYTDFPVKHVPQEASYKEKHGRRVYKSGDSFVVEAGSGGPELSFDTLNGDIYLSLKGDK